jgi:hypothetical protein
MGGGEALNDVRRAAMVSLPRAIGTAPWQQDVTAGSDRAEPLQNEMAAKARFI